MIDAVLEPVEMTMPGPELKLDKPKASEAAGVAGRDTKLIKLRDAEAPPKVEAVLTPVLLTGLVGGQEVVRSVETFVSVTTTLEPDGGILVEVTVSI